MRDLEGKLALVTGGGKGVGKVVARELAARGAHILLNFFHSLEQAKETKAELEASGATVGTSKAALESLTRYLAVEFAPLNIRVNTASCTLIDGDVARAFPDYEEVVDVTVASTPLGRLATAEDLVGVIMFLTSDQSRFVTGQTVLADGGLSLGTVMMSPRQKTAAAPLAAPAPSASAEPAALRVEETEEPDELAVVGMGLVVPGASSPDEFWKVLIDGPDLFRRVPDDRWDYKSFYSEDVTAEDKTYSASSVFITDFSP